MEKIKEILKKIKKRIEKSFIVKLIKFKSTINGLNEKIGDLEKEIQKRNDRIHLMENDLKRLEELENKVPSMEIVIASADKSIKDKNQEINQLKEEKLNIETELFQIKLDLASANIQKEEYEAQIKDLKSDRYLIRKIPAGRTKNTIKTKISKPMSANVTRYMRGEHE